MLSPSGAAVSVRLVDLLVLEFISANRCMQCYDYSSMVTQTDFRAILADTTKRIEGDLAWADDKHHRASWDRPVQVWRQFCEEALIVHDGVLGHPVWQEELLS